MKLKRDGSWAYTEREVLLKLHKDIFSQVEWALYTIEARTPMRPQTNAKHVHFMQGALTGYYVLKGKCGKCAKDFPNELQSMIDILALGTTKEKS
jgi:hypothetical protein